MIKNALLSLLLMSLAHAATAADLKPLWTAKGFAQPAAAVYVAAEKAIFVTSVNGEATAKDGNGFISRLTPEGKLVKLDWVGGLDAPKGITYAQGKLYVVDIDQIVQVDVKTAAVTKRYAANGAKSLADLSLEHHSHFKGQIARGYVSDPADNAIWYLGDGGMSKTLADARLESPTAVLVEGEDLRFTSSTDGGRIKTVPIDGETITDRFSAQPLAPALSGLEPDGKGGYWVAESVGGKIWRVGADGVPKLLLTAGAGVGDLGLIPGKAVLVPLSGGELRAYAISH